MKLDRAFPPTPAAFGDAVFKGIREGEKRMKMKHKLRLSAIAACLVVCLAVLAYAAGSTDRTDSTAAPQSETTPSPVIGGSDQAKTILFVTDSPSPTPPNAGFPTQTDTDEETVYMTEHGLFYHADPVCSGMKNAFPVPVSEAEEEGKRPCPVCLSDRSVEPASYFQKAVDALEMVFPGCQEVCKKHYNTDQFYADLPSTEDRFVTLNLYAGDVRVAQAAFDGEEARLSFRFIDVELRSKLFAGAQEGTLSGKLAELYLRCKEELLGDLLSAVHSSAKSLMPISAEPYNLQSMELSFWAEECMTVSFGFQTQHACTATFTFDVVEGDALREVVLQSY